MATDSGIDETSVGADDRANLVQLLRTAYPHPRFPDGPYERTADAILEQIGESVWHRTLLTRGLRTLDDAAHGPFRDLDDIAASELLHAIADAEFFVFIRGVAVPLLYGDPEVWAALGYEGESFSKGGYVNRGFDDLDWLPDPRVEEYDGSDEFVEVADQDQLKKA
ncbi:hypothetical protein GCM10011492_00660 [Flexivirga endophytica]|uniref:Gluconate 2-dehydrogenase subunit 3 family protein n=1 Tax=Flexivirga endophytica TaxID=1849103 RepID=A0A916SS09_9MICO|nr:hypothetical protein [Flexivirga endophytica]GGB14852.1 hypothetical protein GCM10011492_00660 [Flexivirga endophytica]GHB65394.1 hypothetical protein GCM10008112_37830 [Flexivirga endophytica]